MADTAELSLAYLESHPADAARVMERLAPQQAAALLESAPVRLTAPVLREMLPLHAARCLEPLDDATASGLLRGVGPQGSVALLRYLSQSRRARIITHLPTAMATAFSLVLGYSRGTVGGWMEPGALGLPSDFLARDALERVRQSDQPLVPALYVLDHEQRLRGTVELTDLLRADAEVSLARIMRPPGHALSAQSPLGSVCDHPGWSEHCVLPVVERGERFVGLLHHTALVRALTRGEGATEHRDAGLADLASTYWFGVSSLIEVVVGTLPVRPLAESPVGGIDDVKRRRRD